MQTLATICGVSNPSAAMIILNPFPNYPTDWAKYRQRADAGTLPPDFPRMTTINRFGARYRAAKSYRGAQFADYGSEGTARGYSALLALVMAFSAFEYYFKFVVCTDLPGIDQVLWESHPIEMQSHQEKFVTSVRTDESDQLFVAISPYLSSALQRSIDKMISDEEAYILRYLQVLRHAFVHGHLTPNMDGVSPSTVIGLCKFGYTFLMDMMDCNFSGLLE